MSYFPSKVLRYRQPSTHSLPYTGSFRFGTGRSFQLRTVRSLTSDGDESLEITMLTSTRSYRPSAIKFKFLNWIDSDPLPCDQSQINRLHEPEHLINTIDPMTGDDIEDVTTHPSLEDGNLTVYFETEVPRKAYSDMPLNHPNLRLPFPSSDDDDRGG